MRSNRGGCPMRARAFVIASFVVGISPLGLAQTRPPQTPDPLTIASLTGKDTFDAYCAPCHGRSGKGDGPVGAALRTPPADLRLLTSRHGSFPRDEIVAYVTGSGRPIAAHGSSDMPIWGVIFRGLDPSDTRVKVRLRNVVDYIESLQR
jgi:mono/diheme cytochrome c family protein